MPVHEILWELVNIRRKKNVRKLVLIYIAQTPATHEVQPAPLTHNVKYRSGSVLELWFTKVHIR
jgi:hypothetical protein